MSLGSDMGVILKLVSATLMAVSTVLGALLNHHLSQKRGRSDKITVDIRTNDASTSSTQPIEPQRIPHKARLALKLGLLSIPLPVLAVPAIVTGVRANREIRRSSGKLEGRGHARTGIALGSFMLLVLLVALVGFA